TGVPFCGWNVIDPYGHTLAQSPHCVHRSKNSVSSTAPGGRNQSVRTGTGAGCSGTTSWCLLNSFAALATDTTESLRKSRRPYGESVAIAIQPLHDAIGAQLVDFDAAIARPKFDIPPRMIFADEVEHIALEFGAHILNPRIGREPAERTGKSRHQHDFIFCFR